MSGRWVDLREAAELLGTSTEAVRKRATRGSLRSDRHDGRVVVWVDESRTEGGHEAQVDREALIEAKDHAIRILEDQLREEREARRRADMIIAQLTQANASLAAKVPELEPPAPPEPREVPAATPVKPERAEPADPEREEPEREEPERGQPERAEPRSSTEGPQEATGKPFREEEPERRSWWRRVFGG